MSGAAKVTQVEQWESIALEDLDVVDVYGRNDWTYAHLDGREHTLTIKDVRVVMIPSFEGDKPDQPKLELTFEESSRTYAPGKEVIYRSVVPAFGRRAITWIGKRVTLFPDTWSNGGRSGTRIGIRPANEARKGFRRKRK